MTRTRPKLNGLDTPRSAQPEIRPDPIIDGFRRSNGEDTKRRSERPNRIAQSFAAPKSNFDVGSTQLTPTNLTDDRIPRNHGTRRELLRLSAKPRPSLES